MCVRVVQVETGRFESRFVSVVRLDSLLSLHKLCFRSFPSLYCKRTGAHTSYVLLPQNTSACACCSALQRRAAKFVSLGRPSPGRPAVVLRQVVLRQVVPRSSLNKWCDEQVGVEARPSRAEARAEAPDARLRGVLGKPAARCHCEARVR